MRKATIQSAHEEGPAVFRFASRVVRDAKTAKTSLIIPPRVSRKLRGMTRIEGTINDHPFRATLRRDASGNDSIPVNNAMLNGTGVRVGTTAQLAILGPEPELLVPADLRAELRDSRPAVTMWKGLTPDVQRDWVRWIVSAQTPETRVRRIGRTIDQLSEGKRRPCCVNFYEFMLSRVRGTEEAKS